MSHVICSLALVFLISAMPFYFAMERNSYTEEMAKRELREICDYTSNTLANLYFLANSTNSVELDITKTLLYLPQTVEDSVYMLGITSMDGLNASKVTAFLRDKSWVVGDSWLVPGLKIMNESSLEIGSKSVLAGCHRNSTGFYVWLGEGE
ncbi:MAG: hypothetical protein NWE80_03465 [Candidatus Bathyarchaeota archaeon]|nr:hypothetical protein [Candidatus Bathyarchaeota archaeon]